MMYGTPSLVGLNGRGVAKYSDFGLIKGYIYRKWCKIGGKLVLITHRMSICTKIGDLK